jgi:glutamate---cysteine ligase / carboxylate-amine ligase
MNERTGDQGAGTAAVPIGASEISRLPFGVEIETRSASDALTAVRGWAEDAAARSVRWRASDNFSFGIEEEYFVVDSATKAVVLTRPAQFLTDAKRALGDQVAVEMLQSQIEVATLPHVDAASARAELKYMRQALARVAAQHGLAIVASGTYPTADWWQAQPSAGKRYDAIMHDLGAVGKRDMLCGLHVHVELPNGEDRVEVMSRMLPYLPLFIALSTSSPFWQSQPTGLMGYRLAAYDELPRTGIPELLRSREEFDAYVEALTRAGVIDDASYVWWAMRPSLQHPTLELRAPDSCTLVEDSIAIAALYRSLARMLVRDPLRNAGLTAVERAIIVENKWRAQRYGTHGTFVDERSGCAVRVPDMLDDLLDDLLPDAEALGCAPEVLRCRTIANGGTSADAQLAVFNAEAKSAGHGAALAAVANWLTAATLQ